MICLIFRRQILYFDPICLHGRRAGTAVGRACLTEVILERQEEPAELPPSIILIGSCLQCHLAGIFPTARKPSWITNSSKTSNVRVKNEFTIKTGQHCLYVYWWTSTGKKIYCSHNTNYRAEITMQTFRLEDFQRISKFQLQVCPRRPYQNVLSVILLFLCQ